MENCIECGAELLSWEIEEQGSLCDNCYWPDPDDEEGWDDWEHYDEGHDDWDDDDEHERFTRRDYLSEYYDDDDEDYYDELYDDEDL